MTKIIEILARALLLPLIKSFFNWAYSGIQKMILRKRTIKAIKVAVATRDQRGVESEQVAGRPSGIGEIKEEATVKVRKP